MEEQQQLEAVQRLTRDLKKAAATLSQSEARFLVDAYYQMQDNRIRSANQIRTLKAAEEPHETIGWLFANNELLENNIKSALDTYSSAHVIGRWSKSNHGIGPVIAAGLMAHIDITKAPTVGHIWRFAGLDPTVTWNKGERRPWNASLKTLCWKIGESFVKVSGNDEAVYGKLYVERKAREQANNADGLFADQAKAKLERFKIGKDTDARVWYEGRLTGDAARRIYIAPSEDRTGLTKKLAGDVGSGIPMLPPAHLHARAKRWAVKLFLAHWHGVAYMEKTGHQPPKPYVISHLHHAHEIVCPNWPW